MVYNTGNEKSNKLIINNRNSYQEFIDKYKTYINFVDFNTEEKRKYGFKNKNNLDIIPKQDKILFDDEYNIVCLDFVIFAYKQLVEKYYSLIRDGQISPKSAINMVLSKPKISQLGLDMESIHETNSKEFNSRATLDSSLNTKIRNSQDYSLLYCLETANLKSKIQTHIRYINSNIYKNINGLTITLLESKMANDEEKVKFMSDLNFPILRKLAEQYGFYINQSAPWQLIANLSHPNIKSIVAKLYPDKAEKDITVDFILEQYYNILLYIDYEYQKVFLYNSYIDFYNNSFYFTEPYYCSQQQKTLLNKISRKEPEDYKTFVKDELFFLISYLKMLNSESSFKYDLIEINRISLEVEAIYSSSLDTKKALLYICGKFETLVL